MWVLHNTLEKAFQNGAQQLHDAPRGLLSGVLGYYELFISPVSGARCRSGLLNSHVL